MREREKASCNERVWWVEVEREGCGWRGWNLMEPNVGGCGVCVWVSGCVDGMLIEAGQSTIVGKKEGG